MQTQVVAFLQKDAPTPIFAGNFMISPFQPHPSLLSLKPPTTSTSRPTAPSPSTTPRPPTNFLPEGHPIPGNLTGIVISHWPPFAYQHHLQGLLWPLFFSASAPILPPPNPTDTLHNSQVASSTA